MRTAKRRLAGPRRTSGLIFTSRVAARASRAANRQMMGLPRFWLVCVVPLALADRCARVRTIDEQLVREAAASPCAVIALPGSLTLNISTSGGLVARNYTKIIGLADEVYSGRWQWRQMKEFGLTPSRGTRSRW